MALNPTLQSNVTPEQSITPPSALGAAVGFLDNIGAFKGPPAPPSPSEQMAQDRMTFFTELDAGRQLIASGEEAAGRARINAAGGNWFGRYGAGTDLDVDSAFENTTGASLVGQLYGSATDYSQIRSTPEYGIQVELTRAKNPEFTEAQIEQEAIRATQNKMANDAAIAGYQQGQKVTWIGVEKTYQDGISLLNQDLQTMISQINSDQVVSTEEAAGLREWYKAQTQKFRRPPGVSQEDWASFESDFLGSTNVMVESIIGSLESGGIDTDTKRALDQIVAKAVAKGMLPPEILIQLEPGVGGFDMLKQLSDAGVFGERWQQTLTNVQKMTYPELLNWVTEFENQDASYLDNISTDDFMVLDSEGMVVSLEQDKTSLSDPNLGKATIAMTNIIEKVAGLEDTALTPTFFSQTFDSQFFGKLTEIYDKNPIIGKALVERTDAALASQSSAALVSTQSIAATHGFSMRLVNGKYEFFPDPALLPKGAQYELDKYFGGDWAAAEKARGNHGVATDSQVLATMYRNIGPITRSLNVYNSVEQERLKLNAYVNGEPVPQTSESGVATPQGPSGSISYNVPEEVLQDTDFIGAVQAVSGAVGIESDWLLRAIDFETAGSWSPSVKNPGSSATGLIQFMRSTAAGLGTSTEALAGMDRVGQMEWVQKYLEPYKGKMNNFGDVYMAIHWPKAIGKDETYVMYKAGSPEYNANKNLDTNGDGTVTRGETIASVISRTGGGMMTTPNTGSGPTVSTSRDRQDTTLAVPADILAAGERLSMPPGQGRTPYEAITGEAPTVSTEVPKDTVTQSNIGAPVSDGKMDLSVSQSFSKDIREFLNSLQGRDTTLQIFRNIESMEAAKASGTIKKGDVVLINGELKVVE